MEESDGSPPSVWKPSSSCISIKLESQFMLLSPASETDRRSYRFLWNPKVPPYLQDSEIGLYPAPDESSPYPQHFLNVYFNIILQPAPTSPKWSQQRSGHGAFWARFQK
jgi:hypothetical protein